ETLVAYALRLRATITEPNPIIVGLSFGGMLVTEMAKNDATVTPIIISSNKSTAEFPFWLKIGKYVPVYKWVPNKVFQSTRFGTFWFMGATEEREKRVVKAIINATNIAFTKWAIEAIMHWDNKEIPANIYHIHGTKDRLLPHFFTKANALVPNGGHLMIMTQAAAISKLLSEKILG
ncbi:MAG: alpha/beta hydrolase, partial [Deinococcales bacterium]|nr:alpha/beta hydrolase [Chitinophagaceae bacterium]